MFSCFFVSVIIYIYNMLLLCLYPDCTFIWNHIERCISARHTALRSKS